MDKNALQEIASQLACPTGKNGIATGEKMNAVNAFITQTAIQQLAPKQGDSVIEIGPGNGLLSLPIIESIGPQGHYLGIDHPVEMCRQAKANLQNYACPDVTLLCCIVNEASIGKGAADSLLAINLLYFIEDLAAFFSHIKPWLKTGACVVFGVRSPDTLNALPFTRYGFNIHTITAITAALVEAGFTAVESTRYDEGNSPFDHVELLIDSVIIKAVCT